MSNQPIIGITMGDAAGVGPEIIVKALDHVALYEKCRPIVIGDAKRLQKAIDITHSPLSIRAIDSVDDAHHDVGTIDCIDLGLIPEDLPFGQLSPVAGNAAYQFIAKAVELASTSEIQAICTAPLNKGALRMGGHNFPGHTEILAHLSGVEEVSMMLVAPNLRVIHVTTHLGLIDAINKINDGLVERTIRRGYDTLVKAGISDPRIGVCGINPHAGENGLFGNREEEKKIMHALAMVQLDGIDATGPLPADTLFYRAIRGDFDLVVAMYHDQGHGPVKVLGLEAGVNITVGLDVIRTSVDHGTAFDIAGTGKADEGSMVEALHQASALASNKLANYEKPPRNVIEFPRECFRTTPRGR
ncbi:D-threonate 4-phosphate dehydrogenase [Carnimonas sp. R-84981]|uniref:4-hydroxythreonine-4-phosphate dehydrogenase PdxA n=1 Tax=Carnimonas bestiolae TaxID=3402172 RepID=UPI003EDB6D50